MTVEDLRRWLVPAIERANETTFEDVAVAIAAGEKQLWVQPEGAAVTYLYENVDGTTALHVELAGGELNGILSRVPEMVEYARAHGAVKITMNGRKGWARVLKDWRIVAPWRDGFAMERDA